VIGDRAASQPAVLDRAAPADRLRALLRQHFAVSFAGFFLLLAAWALAAPYSGTPDEREHLLRAASVVTGQIVPPAYPGNPLVNAVTVPGSLDRAACWQFHPELPASCAGEPGGDSTPLVVADAAGRYNPVYYAVVGWPLALSPNWTGILLARLVSSALCAAMLAAAFSTAMRHSRGRLAALGITIATTPMVAQMGGAINPNGLEIASGVALFAAAMPLVDALRAQRPQVSAGAGQHRLLPARYPDSQPELTRLLAQVGIAALALALLRAAGPLWLLVSLLAVCAPFQWRLVRQLWAWRAARWWGLAIGLAAAAGVAWTEVVGTAQFGDYTDGTRYAPSQALWWAVTIWPKYLDQAVGVMSWLDTNLPTPVYVVWEVAAGALVLVALVATDRAGRWRLAAVGTAAFVVPTIAMLSVINSSGAFSQGRYFLPVLVGLPIAAAFLLAAALPPSAALRRAVRIGAAVLLPVQVGSLAYTMVRWQRGLTPEPGLGQLNPLGGTWHPPLGSVVPLLAAMLGAAVIGSLLWRRVAVEAAAGSEGPGSAQIHEQVAELQREGDHDRGALEGLPTQQARRHHEEHGDVEQVPGHS
jgi:hypothetical protein